MTLSIDTTQHRVAKCCIVTSVTEVPETTPPRELSWDWWDAAEVAKILGVDRNTLYVWKNRKLGPPCYQMNTALRYRSDEVLAWLEARRSPGDGTVKPMLPPRDAHGRFVSRDGR